MMLRTPAITLKVLALFLLFRKIRIHLNTKTNYHNLFIITKVSIIFKNSEKVIIDVTSVSVRCGILAEMKCLKVIKKFYRKYLR